MPKMCGRLFSPGEGSERRDVDFVAFRVTRKHAARDAWRTHRNGIPKHLRQPGMVNEVMMLERFELLPHFRRKTAALAAIDQQALEIQTRTFAIRPQVA